jgi:hypothetical protein
MHLEDGRCAAHPKNKQGETDERQIDRNLA